MKTWNQICFCTNGGSGFIISFLVCECIDLVPVFQLNPLPQKQNCIKYQAKADKELDFNKSLMLLQQNSYTSLPFLLSSFSILSSIIRNFNHRNTKLSVKYAMLNQGIKINGQIWYNNNRYNKSLGSSLKTVIWKLAETPDLSVCQSLGLACNFSGIFHMFLFYHLLKYK